MSRRRQDSFTVPPKATARQLRMKAELILKSRKNANVLCEVLEMFNREENNYTPLLLTLEMIFCTMLRRGDMSENETMQAFPQCPESIHARWLRSNYELATVRSLACMKRGDDSSRAQALVTCCKMMVEEGKNPLYSEGFCFPINRLKNILDTLLDPEHPQTVAIQRLQEYVEYRDVQQCGLKLLFKLAYKKEVQPKIDYHTWYVDRVMPGIIRMYPSARSLSDIYMQNYLELFDVLTQPSLERPQRPLDEEENREEQYLLERDGTPAVEFNPESCKHYVNGCWGYCVKWPLRATERNHRRALIILVDRIMPYLTKPALANDLLCDSLDCGSSISIIALRGLLELVTRHQIEYPGIYDRLYGMFEPNMFATRSKKRLIHLADVFLSSNRLPETMVAAFAKRLARLALIASPEDANDLLQLLANLVQRHPDLKKMLRNDQVAILSQFPLTVPKDPYMMEEMCSIASRAIQSSLWEVFALQQHFTPEVRATAQKVLALADGGSRPADLASPYSDCEQFDMEIRRRFRTIEMNFARLSPTYYVVAAERLSQYWNADFD